MKNVRKVLSLFIFHIVLFAINISGNDNSDIQEEQSTFIVTNNRLYGSGSIGEAFEKASKAGSGINKILFDISDTSSEIITIRKGESSLELTPACNLKIDFRNKHNGSVIGITADEDLASGSESILNINICGTKLNIMNLFIYGIDNSKLKSLIDIKYFSTLEACGCRGTVLFRDWKIMNNSLNRNVSLIEACSVNDVEAGLFFRNSTINYNCNIKSCISVNNINNLSLLNGCKIYQNRKNEEKAIAILLLNKSHLNIVNDLSSEYDSEIYFDDTSVLVEHGSERTLIDDHIANGGTYEI